MDSSQDSSLDSATRDDGDWKTEFKRVLTEAKGVSTGREDNVYLSFLPRYSSSYQPMLPDLGLTLHEPKGDTGWSVSQTATDAWISPVPTRKRRQDDVRVNPDEQEKKIIVVPSTVCKVFADGACKGNPGDGGAGAVIFLGSGTRMEMGRYIGRCTNNVAEYTGLIIGLEAARDLGVMRVRVHMDSMLVVEQVNGRWKCKKAHLKPLLESARRLSKVFTEFELSYIPREENALADSLANETIMFSSSFKRLEKDQ